MSSKFILDYHQQNKEQLSWFVIFIRIININLMLNLCYKENCCEQIVNFIKNQCTNLKFIGCIVEGNVDGTMTTSYISLPIKNGNRYVLPKKFLLCTIILSLFLWNFQQTTLNEVGDILVLTYGEKFSSDCLPTCAEVF